MAAALPSEVMAPYMFSVSQDNKVRAVLRSWLGLPDLTVASIASGSFGTVFTLQSKTDTQYNSRVVKVLQFHDEFSMPLFKEEREITEITAKKNLSPAFYGSTLVRNSNSGKYVAGIMMVKKYDMSLKHFWDERVRKYPVLSRAMERMGIEYRKSVMVSDMRICARVTQLLHELADANIVHGDAKPANILVNTTPDGKNVTDIILTDFGKSRLTVRGRGDKENATAAQCVHTMLYYGGITSNAPSQTRTLKEYKRETNVIRAVHDQLLGLGPIDLEEGDAPKNSTTKDGNPHHKILDGLANIFNHVPQDWNNADAPFEYNYMNDARGTNARLATRDAYLEATQAHRLMLYARRHNDEVDEIYLPLHAWQIPNIFNFFFVDIMTFFIIYDIYDWENNMAVPANKRDKGVPPMLIATIIAGLATRQQISDLVDMELFPS